MAMLAAAPEPLAAIREQNRQIKTQRIKKAMRNLPDGFAKTNNSLNVLK